MRLLALLVVILSGCATIDYDRPPPADFPKLEIEEYTTLEPCSSSLLFPVLGCAYLDFERGVCEVYLPARAPQWLVRHEYAHCLGYEHLTETTVRDMWERHKSKSENNKALDF